MTVERALAQRLEQCGQLLPRCHRERRGHANVMERALRVVEPEEERPDSPTTALVPTKASDDAIGRARVLDLEHRAFARLVDTLDRLGDDPIEAGAFKAIEPLDCDGAVARHRREVDRRLERARGALRAARDARLAGRRADRCRRPRAGRSRRKPAGVTSASLATREAAGCSRNCSASKSRPLDVAMTISPSSTQPGGSRSRKSVVELREIPIERPQVAALNVDVGRAREHDRPKAVPLRLEQESIAARQHFGHLREHRLDWRFDRKHR